MNSKLVLWIIQKISPFFTNLFFLLFIFFYSSILQAQWVQTGGAGITGVNDFAVSGLNIFVGTNSGGIFLSTNSGASWTNVNNELTSYSVGAFFVNGTNLFVVATGGVYLSTNDGSSWNAVNNGLLDTIISTLTGSGTNLFAGTYSGNVYLSTNNGTSWSKASNGLTTSPIYALTISGTNIFAGTAGAGVYLSTNNGTSWTAVNNGLDLFNSSVYTLAPSGTNIIAGTGGHYTGNIYVSTDNGTNWTLFNNGLGDNIYAIVFSGTNIFAGTARTGVYSSTINGTSWTQASNGLNETFISSLAVSGTNLFAGTYGGVWKRPLSEFTDVTEEVNNLPKGITLSQNYPNPWNPTTSINYSLVKEGNVSISVYNAIGSKVATIVNGYKPAGSYSVQFNGSNLPSGIYFYKLEAGQFSQVKKMILVK
jgi:photosystem II stability/assembly factor-like uncharacterized protein